LSNHAQLADFIWHVADHLVGDYQPEDYEKVILPFTLLRRLDCVLGEKQNKVRERYQELTQKNTNPATIDKLLCNASGLPFYNCSHYTVT